MVLIGWLIKINLITVVDSSPLTTNQPLSTNYQPQSRCDEPATRLVPLFRWDAALGSKSSLWIWFTWPPIPLIACTEHTIFSRSGCELIEVPKCNILLRDQFFDMSHLDTSVCIDHTQPKKKTATWEAPSYNAIMVRSWNTSLEPFCKWAINGQSGHLLSPNKIINHH